jgi:magnesium-transporting ATPase (P-type)
MAGEVDAVFFDKKGTLTQPGMSFISVHCTGISENELTNICVHGMAVCHTLSTSRNGELLGNHIDKASFEYSGAVLEMKKDGLTRINVASSAYLILKAFDFDNNRQTQTVVVQDISGGRWIFTKGSPEAIKALCLPYTVPTAFDASASIAAKQAIYQLAIAFKSCDPNLNVADSSRENLETKLFFGGFLNFRNSLRHDAPKVLRDVADAKIPTAIITGDHVLAGAAIAREVGMIRQHGTLLVGRKVSKKEVEWVNFDTDAVSSIPIEDVVAACSHIDLAITGEVWNVMCKMHPRSMVGIAERIRVFGRCSPADKVSVVSKFVEEGRVTLMCGDGQNDCGSLKTAHVGIALSSTEASLVAPFTALDKSITAVTDVLKEGRCATASSLASYSFFILFGQLIASMDFAGPLLKVYASDWCWFSMYSLVSISLAFSLPLSRCAQALSARRPTCSLLSSETVLRIVVHIEFNFLFLTVAFAALWSQDWFRCRKQDEHDIGNFASLGDSYESSVLFLMVFFQTVATAMSMNFGADFRQGWFGNRVFASISLFWMMCVFIITLYPSKFSCVFRVNCSNEVRNQV